MEQLRLNTIETLNLCLKRRFIFWSSFFFFFFFSLLFLHYVKSTIVLNVVVNHLTVCIEETHLNYDNKLRERDILFMLVAIRCRCVCGFYSHCVCSFCICCINSFYQAHFSYFIGSISYFFFLLSSRFLFNRCRCAFKERIHFFFFLFLRSTNARHNNHSSISIVRVALLVPLTKLPAQLVYIAHKT